MAMGKANDTQVGGSHYSQGNNLQHWDLVVMYGWDYFQGQITKYVMRWRQKNGIEDLKKARHFLDKYIEAEEAKMLSQTCLAEQPADPTRRYVDQDPTGMRGYGFGLGRPPAK